jgi:dienelactone hydrolase
LYVVDPSRQWYGATTTTTTATTTTTTTTTATTAAASDHPPLQHYVSRLQAVTRDYQHVVMLGDSMGATAALLFAPLATHVLAFCPQARVCVCVWYKGHAFVY